MPLTLSSSLEYLATAILLLNNELRVVYANPAAENLFGLSNKHIVGLSLPKIFIEGEELGSAATYTLHHNVTFTEHELTLTPYTHVNAHQHPLLISCTFTPLEMEDVCVVLEFQRLDKQHKVVREERMLLQQQANRELLRNLAHEIKNPLGGLRGAAQLLERELSKPALREYTQVIIKEADRLQSLMDRLLAPHNRLPRFSPVNIHAVLNRVKNLILAETPVGITLCCDYDTSLPEMMADEEQLIQAVLNVARNAVQAMRGEGILTFRTRIARQVTVAKKRHRLAIQLQIIDTGPGVPEDIREKIFYPLVSGQENGTGLGLTIAQGFINEHHGTIECQSQPGHCCFTFLLPIDQS